ncbi:MAG: DUF484 family protein [Burkholderiaceae bacterium]|nr:DUF484 family protein [Burkholderiaceae bacterium]
MTTLQSQDIALYLARHVDFFEHHPQLLSQMQLPNAHEGAAISLVERQSLMLRERVKALEARVAEMVRNGQENDAILDKLVTWVRALLSETDETALPATLIDELKQIFDVPYAGVRLWRTQPQLSALDCALSVESDTITFANSMRVPFCGSNVGFEAATWLDSDGAVQSLALIPLRFGPGGGVNPETFGMLVLGSADADRFHASMGTAFLERIGELASAALARLRA